MNTEQTTFEQQTNDNFSRIFDELGLIRAHLGIEDKETEPQILQQPTIITPFDAGMEFIGLDEDDDTRLLINAFTEAGIQCNPSVTAWCAAFGDLCLFKAGHPIVDSLAAKDFYPIGEEGDGSQSDFACWRNHVAVVAGMASREALIEVTNGIMKITTPEQWEAIQDDNGDILMVLGGNQSDMVNISPKEWYDRYSKFLGYRRV